MNKKLQIINYKLQMGLRARECLCGLQYLPGYSARSFTVFRMTGGEHEDEE